MGTRLQLQIMLELLIGSRNVYFQPPESVRLKYPCILYSRSNEKVGFANDKPYTRQKQYQITVIDKDPDSVISKKIETLPMCAFDRSYTLDQLNHNVYNLYY